MHNNLIVERKRNLKFEYVTFSFFLKFFFSKDYSSFVGYCFSNGECISPTLPHTSIITNGILKNKHCDERDTKNT